MMMIGGRPIMEQKQALNILYQPEADVARLSEEEVIQVDKDTSRTYFPFYHQYKELQRKEDRSEAEELEMHRLKETNREFREKTGRILKSYCSKDKQVGYVQGFNSIVAALLYIFYQGEQQAAQQPRKPDLGFELGFTEEEVFYTFYGFMFVLGWRNNFTRDMDDVERLCDAFKSLLEEKDEELFEKFFQNSIPSVAYFASFYLTVCMHITPMEYAAKILDLFLIIGEETIHYLLMGILISQKTHLLSLENEEQILNFLKNDLMRQVFKSEHIGSFLMLEDWEKILEWGTGRKK